MKKPYGYLTTGEFANICRVKKQTLFHYDQIGILSPEIMGGNGYRYYSYLQLDTFNAISMLKELDMPLAEIKKFLDARSPSDFLMLLEKQSRLVDEKIEELQWLKKFISERISITREGISAEHGRIYLETYPDQFFVISEHHGGVEDPDIYATLGQHMQYRTDHSVYSSSGIGGIIPVADAPWDSVYRYSHFYTKVSPEYLPGSAETVLIPAHSAICVCTTKGFDCIPEMLNKLMDYAEKHNFSVGDYFYEDLLLDDMSNFNFDTYTVKLSLPITE
ncbi:MAG: MerR family transcriptional regulator [Firmicutes bacterium]|nr:MerR family transcriptional regulator [Bacillota bacterium]